MKTGEAFLLRLAYGYTIRLTHSSNNHARSIKGPISVPVSLLSAVECYRCREVTLNYSDSLLFHGGDMVPQGKFHIRYSIPTHEMFIEVAY